MKRVRYIPTLLTLWYLKWSIYQSNYLNLWNDAISVGGGDNGDGIEHSKYAIGCAPMVQRVISWWGFGRMACKQVVQMSLVDCYRRWLILQGLDDDYCCKQVVQMSLLAMTC